MAQLFIGAATFSFECGVSLHDFPNFVPYTAERHRVSRRRRLSPQLRRACVCGRCSSSGMRRMRTGLFAKRHDKELGYRFKASLANLGS